MVDLSRLMQDAAILEVIDKSADEASSLSAQNSYQAMRIEELERDLAAANAWREVVLNELIVAHIYTKEHDTNPRKAVQDAITWNCQVALDPAVSSDARALIAANTKLAAKPDVAGLVEAYDEARYHFEDWTGGADTPSKQAELKRRVDAKDAARQRILDALLSLHSENATLRKHAENFVKCRIRANGYSDWSKEMLDDVFEDYRADFPKETDHDK